MNNITTTTAIIDELRPASIAACPNEGPTIASSTILAVVGRRPDFNTLAKSLVSSIVKLPEIDELPPAISDCTVGAEYTTLSNTIAIEIGRAEERRVGKECRSRWSPYA